ncbi:uncharacterized protein PG998_012773 [Apiospora kogelbergensis]|uniref:uncharacterized protein n=1 Tax=Apiospora kogelbergensis TaxID=1337665 RepID=UPI00312CCCFA
MPTLTISPKWRSGLPVLTWLLLHFHLSVVEGVGAQLFPRNYGGGAYQMTTKTRAEIQGDPTTSFSDAGYAAETNLGSVITAATSPLGAVITAATSPVLPPSTTTPGPEPDPTILSERTPTPTCTTPTPIPTTMRKTPTPSYPSDLSSFSSSSSSSSSCATTEGATFKSPSPSSGGGGGGGGDGSFTDEDLKLRLGLGIGLGIGIPLLTLLGFGCFLLWRLLGKTRLLDFHRTAPVAAADAEKYQQKKLSLDNDNDEASTGPRELMSTEFYEAEGASKKIGPAELGI